MIHRRSVTVSLALALSVLVGGLVWRGATRGTPSTDTSLRHGHAGYIPLPELQFAEHEDPDAIRTVEGPSSQHTR